jgi:hypothetical protein
MERGARWNGDLCVGNLKGRGGIRALNKDRRS